MNKVNWAILALFFCGLSHASASEIPKAKSDYVYKTSLVTDEIAVPWAMVQLPSGDILVSDRAGQLRLIQQGKLVEQSISGLPDIYAGGQGGLLDLALHPDFNNNQWLYFTYSSPQEGGEGSNTALMRAKLNVEKRRLEQQELLYKGEDNTTARQHFGSRIAFDNDGYVYFSIGDRGEREVKPQRLDLDGGKIYRLHDDGRIPDDNPFVDVATFPNAKTATYSYGHRNPQGLAKHPVTGAIWSHEHGPKGGDEVNLIGAGKNYGWPVISFGVNYSGTSFTELTEKAGMEQPLFYWVPSIAPSGMVFVTSDKYPEWQGKLLVGSLKFHHLVLLDIADHKVLSQTKWLDNIGRVRSVMQGSDGFIYVGVDGGAIYRIEATEK